MLPRVTLPPDFDARALEIWDDYQRTHDLSDRIGQVGAIDPESGSVWIDESGVDVVRQMEQEGKNVPVFFVRIGYPSFVTKGRR